jgi:hypothetical protein
MNNQIATQLRIPEDLCEKVKAIAESEFRTMNAQLVYFISEGVALHEQRQKFIASHSDAYLAYLESGDNKVSE